MQEIKDRNIIEINDWLKKQPANKNTLWNDWDNIHQLLKPKIGKLVYTKSCWADIPGLFEATLFDGNMTIKIGEKLKCETVKRGYSTEDTYSWLTRDKIFVDEESF
jgi:hypothetical protein